MANRIKLSDGTVIIERKETDKAVGMIYSYYIGKEYVLGVQPIDRFTREDLERLNENGYFEAWKGARMRESLKRAQAEYAKKCRIFSLRVNRDTEQDIIEWLAKPGAGTRIKQLIRKDIKGSSQ